MAVFILRRLVWILPTIILVLVITFVLTQVTPGDPIYRYYGSQEGLGTDPKVNEREYALGMQELGLDRPLFYLAVLPLHYPDTIFRIPVRERGLIHFLLKKYGHWEQIAAFQHALRKYMSEARMQAPDEFGRIAQLVYGTPDPNDITVTVQSLANEPSAALVLQSYEVLQNNKLGPKKYLPAIRWQGMDNQFHRWLTDLLRLDFGFSRTDARPVAAKLSEALRWTLLINLISILIAYLLSIPLGMYMGWYQRSVWLKVIRLILFAIYAIPIFWLATLLVVFFTTSEYGSWTDIFQAVGIWRTVPGDNFFALLLRNAGQLVIPILCLSLTITAYVSRQVENSVIEEKSKRYIWQAKAKGLGDHAIIWKHLFRNASFPLITLISGIFPASISGSLVLEVICNIPGMGRLLVDAIFSQDWSVVIVVVFIASFLTILGLLLADILYRIADPRLQTAGKR